MHVDMHTQAEISFIEAQAAVAALKRRGAEVVPPVTEVRVSCWPLSPQPIYCQPWFPMG